MVRDYPRIIQYGLQAAAYLNGEKSMIKFPAHELIFGYEEIPEILKYLGRILDFEIPVEKIGILSMVSCTLHNILIAI